MRRPIDANDRLYKSYDYALIDTHKFPATRWHDLPSHPISRRHGAFLGSLLPRLVCIDQMSSAHCQALYDADETCREPGLERMVQCLIKSTLSIDDMCRHLTAVLLEDRGEAGYRLLRLYESGVSEQLEWMLDETQWDALIGPCAAWACFQEGRWWRKATTSTDVRILRLTIADEQWRAIRDIELIRDILDKQRVGDHERVLNGKLAWHALEKARLAGITDRVDLMSYAGNVVRYGPAIHEDPSMRMVVIDSAGEPRHYTRTTARIPVSEWLIRSESAAAAVKRSRSYKR